MFRISLSARQVSRRLVSKLAAIEETMKETTDASPKTAATTTKEDVTSEKSFNKKTNINNTNTSAMKDAADTAIKNAGLQKQTPGPITLKKFKPTTIEGNYNNNNNIIKPQVNEEVVVDNKKKEVTDKEWQQVEKKKKKKKKSSKMNIISKKNVTQEENKTITTSNDDESTDIISDNVKVPVTSSTTTPTTNPTPAAKTTAKNTTSEKLQQQEESNNNNNNNNNNTNNTTLTQRKTPMIKAFRIEDVLTTCKPGDGVFARRLPQGGCQFFAWPGTPLSVASNAVATMPDTIRTVHAIFGREKTPIDLVLDIDCPVPQEHWSMSKIRPFQKKLLDEVMSVIVKEIEAIGEKIETQVVLQSPNLKKASFHVHTKLKDVAFEDYNALHGFLHRFHNKIPTVDLQIYRPNGMLRMFRCMKENHTSAIVVFEDKDWNIGFKEGIVPDPVAALHSACVRETGTYSRLLKFNVPRISSSALEHSDNNNNNNNNNNNSSNSNSNNNNSGGPSKSEVRIPTILVPRTESEAIENASNWIKKGSREADVGDWRSWIRLGINAYRVAYHFRDAATLQRPAMEELLEAWVEASKKCPLKFRPGTCEAKWNSFDINKLSKAPESDWWQSYIRLGRMSGINTLADAPQTSTTTNNNNNTDNTNTKSGK